MRLLGLDYETTGLDRVNDRIIEVGLVLWDTDARLPLQVVSELVDPIKPIPDEIAAVHGITDAMVEEFGISEFELTQKINGMSETADYIVAHYGTIFDQPFTNELYLRQMGLPPSKVWVDTSVDLPYAERVKTRNLLHLAAEHGFLPAQSHRAVFDVMTMFRILGRYDLDAVIARAKEPMVCLEALVEFVDKEKAKERGYRWFPLKKIWWRNFKESDAIVERKECGFSTRILPEAPE